MKRRLLAIFLAVSMLVSMLAFPAEAETASGTSGSLTWVLEDGVLTISGSGEMRNYGSSYDTSPWYDYRESITAIVIEDGVTSIGNRAFPNCSNLENISIPDSVTSIGASAFYGCTSLTSVTIPDSVTSIGANAFGSSGLLTVSIGNGVIDIESGAFWDCTSLTSVTIPDSVTSIGVSAFYGCSSLTNVTIGSGVTSIGNYAFQGCSSLTAISIPDSVTSMGISVFMNCTSLSSAIISGSLVSISSDTFFDCVNLTSVTIGSGVTSIGNYAFAGCSSLTSITLPDGVTSIGRGAFSQCSSLASIIIPDSITVIGDYAFEGCSSLTDVYYSGSEEDWSAISILGRNSKLTEATIHYYSTGPDDGSDSLSENDDETDDESDGDETGGSEYFILEWDNNIFEHTTDNFFKSGESITYLISDTYYSKLLDLVKESGSSADLVTLIRKRYSTWNGSCLGLSVSMALASIGYIGDVTDANDGKFYGLYPYDTDNNLRDVINYFQLYQYIQSPNVEINKDDPDSMTLSQFLETLVTYAIQSEENETPFILGYCYNNTNYLTSAETEYLTNLYANKGKTYHPSGGHAVVVCGYEYALNSEGNYEHRITIYDPNNQESYYTMYIADDYSSFDYQDANMSGMSTVLEKAGYGTSDKIRLEHVWTSMMIYTVDWMLSAEAERPDSSDGTLSSVLNSSLSVSLSSSGSSASEDTVDLVITAYKNFTLTNAEGEVLYYDGTAFGGDMEIYSLHAYGENEDSDVLYKLEVDASDSFVISEFEDDFEIYAEIGSACYIASSTGADTMTLSLTDGITFTGDSYTFTGGSTVEFDSSDLICISGTAEGDCTIEITESNVILNTEDSCSELSVEVYQDTDYEYTELDEDAQQLTVGDDGVEVTIPADTEGKTSSTISFKDVSSGDYYYDAVLWAVEQGITTGTTSTTFSPTSSCTRGQVVTFLYRAAGEPEVSGAENPFSDVSSSDYYYSAVLWAVENGITTGTTSTTFSPNDTCTRGQVVTFLYRYAGTQVTDTDNPFTDVSSGDYYYTPVLWAVENGVTTGTTTTTFSPAAECTRGQVVTFLYRALAG